MSGYNPYVPGPVHDMYEAQKRDDAGMNAAAKEGDMGKYHKHEQDKINHSDPNKFGGDGSVRFE